MTEMIMLTIGLLGIFISTPILLVLESLEHEAKQAQLKTESTIKQLKKRIKELEALTESLWEK